MEFKGKKYVALLQGSEMSAGLHFRNLILANNSYWIATIILCL